MKRLWLCVVLLLFVGNRVLGQWYTDPHNPVAVYEHVQVRGGLMADLNGGAYFFIEGPAWNCVMSHVNVDGQWSCPLPGVIIGPYSSAFAHTEVLDPDNNLISHVSECDPTWPDSPSLLNKWSPAGQQVWQTFSFPDTLTRPSLMVSDNAGGCIILIRIEDGEQHRYYIQRFNASGQPQFGWTERPLVHNPVVLDMIGDGMGGAFAIWDVEDDSISNVQMQHIRSDGSFSFADSGITVIEDIFSVTSLYPSCIGSFILLWRRVQPQSQYFFTRIDSVGTVIWDYLYTGSWYVFPDNLGGVYFSHEDTAYSRISSLGELVFSNHLLAPWSLSDNHWCISPAGEFVILYWDEDNQVWTLQKLDSTGTQVWTEAVAVLYGMPPSYYPYEEYLTADTRGGTILCFVRYDATYFTRVDAYGNVGRGLYVNQSPIQVPTTFQITAYPNPFNNQINLTWTTNIGGTIWLNITNLLGQRIISTQLPTHTTNFIWDGRDAWGTPISSGMYYATLQTTKIKQSIQIVLIK